MGERKGTKGLELWCRRMTEGYPGVKIDNMTTSWRDGLAFCAIIHHFRPDLIEFSKLKKNDIYYNNDLAFRTAEDHLGIPALLEPEDMVEYTVPDRLSILTYLSQFYRAFASNSNSPTITAAKRPPPADLQMSTSSGPPKKTALRTSNARREPCVKCGFPVFIAERLNVGNALYHRTCFRCARCDSKLTLANYYETESNEFCCETCPDEETSTKIKTNIFHKSLSDEEKSASLKEQSDFYSANFEDVLEDPKDTSLTRNFTLDRKLGAQFTGARSEFMSTQLESSSSDSDSDSNIKITPPEVQVSNIPPVQQDVVKHSENIDAVGSILLPSFSDSGFPSSKLKDQNLYESQDIVTKDSITENERPGSLSIKSRIMLFEGDTGQRRDVRKTDVNKEFSKLSEVSSEKTKRQSSSDANADRVKDNLEHSQSRVIETPRLQYEESCVEEDDVHKNAFSGYDADNSINFVLSEKSELGIVSSSKESMSQYVSVSDDQHMNKEIFNQDEVISSEHNQLSSPVLTGISSEEYCSANSLYKSDLAEDSILENDAPIEVTSNISETEDNSVIIISSVSEEAIVISDTSEENLDRAPCNVESISEANVEDKFSSSIEYPDDLNPFGDEESEELPETSKYVSLNPFGDTDDEQDEVPEKKLDIAPRLVVPPKSTNPFEDDNDEDDENTNVITPQPAVRKLLKAPRITLTPLDFDDAPPVPKPRSSRSSSNAADTLSLTGSGRKKKPAPKPPTMSIFYQDANESPMSSITSSPSQSVCHSPKSTPKNRKMKRAPPPPTSTPLDTKKSEGDGELALLSQIETGTDVSKPLQFRIGSEENLKSAKDEMNRNRQSASNLPLNDMPSSLPNKSTYGKWKRRKGQAPSRPIPQKRFVQSLPIEKIKHELDLIEIQQSGLEKQGVTLEKLIRERSEGPGANEDETLAPEVEDMVIQLFEIVNEKNELFRKQTELMYLRRQHRLEMEYAELEYQIRCLMLQPEANKTDSEKSKEEELTARLLENVERRNEIVDCLEMNRRREIDEDTSISDQMSMFSLQRNESTPASEELSKKEKNKSKKNKEKKSKKNKMDADKDIDESETQTVKNKKKKKKFNIF